MSDKKGSLVFDANIRSAVPLISPNALKLELPASEAMYTTILESREIIKNILAKKDSRFLVIVGPCSIHDPQAAMEYANRLNDLRKNLGDKLYIVMRVYFEKPRTTTGWKGLISDPHLNGSNDIPTGLRMARSLLREIVSLGLPTATELLDPIIPQYIDDLVSWAAVGARTTESQTHRMMASGLSVPVGFKNNTDGSLQVSLDAMKAAQSPHAFLGIDGEGRTCIISTNGNPWGHVVLRGGKTRTNYDKLSIEEASQALAMAGLESGLLVDCSHANSGKKHQAQELVWKNVLGQRQEGNKCILGAMLESNLSEGSQSIPTDLSHLKYGVSVTDACVNWESTKKLLEWAVQSLA